MITSTKFFISLIILSIISIISLNPKNNTKINNDDIFEFAFYDFEATNVTQNGLDTLVKSNSAIKYKDYFYMEKPIFVQKNNTKHMQMLQSNFAKYVPNKYLELNDNIYYAREDGIELSTNYLYYDTIKKVVSSNTLFNLNIKNSIVYGKGFEYQMLTKKLSSHDINASIANKK